MIALSLESFAPAPIGAVHPPLIIKGRLKKQKDKEDIETPVVRQSDLLSQNTWR